MFGGNVREYILTANNIEIQIYTTNVSALSSKWGLMEQDSDIYQL